MTYDDWLFEQDWNAATNMDGGSNFMPSETGVGGTFEDFQTYLGYNDYDNNYSNPSVSEVVDSIGLAVEPGFFDSIKDAVSNLFGGSASNAIEDKTVSAARAGATVASTEKSESGGLLDKIKGVSSWMDQNKELTKILAGAVGGALKSSSDSNLLERKYELDQQTKEADIARKSASITGLRKPTGLINRGPLTYKDGKPVYQNGKLAKG